MTLPLTEAEAAAQIARDFEQFRQLHLADVDGPLRFTLAVENMRRNFRLKRGDEDYRMSIDAFRFARPDGTHRTRLLFEIEIEALTEEAGKRLPELRRHLAHLPINVQYSVHSKYEQGLQELGLGLRPLASIVYGALRAEPIGIAGFLVGILGLLVGIFGIFHGK